MNFVLRHLADALVLLREYKEGCPELAWRIDSHVHRASELTDDLEARRELLSVNVVKSENLKKVAEIYSKLALGEIEKAGKVSISKSGRIEWDEPDEEQEKQVLMEEKDIEDIEDDEVVVIDESDEDIEFSFERV